MQTTDYGMIDPATGKNTGRNEFGEICEPKDVDYSRMPPGCAMQGARLSLSDTTIRAMAADFHRRHGVPPSTLHLPEPCGHHKYLGLMVPGVGLVGLDIHYGAQGAYVA